MAKYYNTISVWNKNKMITAQTIQMSNLNATSHDNAFKKSSG